MKNSRLGYIKDKKLNNQIKHAIFHNKNIFIKYQID